MRRSCRWLVTGGELEVAPTDGIELPAPPDKPVPILTDDEIAALLKTCDAGDEQRDHQSPAAWLSSTCSRTTSSWMCADHVAERGHLAGRRLEAHEKQLRTAEARQVGQPTRRQSPTATVPGSSTSQYRPKVAPTPSSDSRRPR